MVDLTQRLKECKVICRLISFPSSRKPIFAKTLDRIGMGLREDGNEIRRQITLHSFRRWVKSTISDLGYADYSEWFIGHSGSTYWRKKDHEKAEIFKKIEPYLTFLNITQLSRQGADLESKLEELQTKNQELIQKNIENDNRIRLQIEARDEEIQSLRSEMRSMKEIVNKIMSSP